MEELSEIDSERMFFQRRIYLIFLAVGLVCLLEGMAFPQSLHSYRTIRSGIFGDITTWEIYDGTDWQPAVVKPGAANDIYIDQTHLLTLTGNEQVHTLYINAENDAGQKLNLAGFELEIFGSLRAFSGAAPGIPSGAWNSQNWIGNSIESKLVFKGNSRVIIPKNAWSGFSTQSRYSVIFDPIPEATLTIEEPFKALGFILRSGTVFQKLDTSLIPGHCSTLSFNNELSFFGTGPLGRFIVEDGATFLSECNDNILVRSVSGSVSAELFSLRNGGRLILEGSSPQMEAAQFEIDGEIIFQGGGAPKSFLTSSFDDAAPIIKVHHLELKGNQSLILPADLFISGDLISSGGGAIIASNSHLRFVGIYDQKIEGVSPQVKHITLDKPNGIVHFNEDTHISETLTMQEGAIDFHEKDLYINSSGVGRLEYTKGSWIHLKQFSYLNIPFDFTETTGTFPFWDRYQGGIRKVQILGKSLGGDLILNFIEQDGAEYNANFNDSDTTPILYQLHSYFRFSGINHSPDLVELRISASQLIVDNVDDLRIVGTGYPAPGTHLYGIDPIELWARRELGFYELEGPNFTIGSFRTLSILPVRWQEISAQWIANHARVSWNIAQERDTKVFEVLRSKDILSWEIAGKTPSYGDSDTTSSYSFEDGGVSVWDQYFYQIRQISFSNDTILSPVARLDKARLYDAEQVLIFPNPHRSGKLQAVFPDRIIPEECMVTVYTLEGRQVLSYPYDPHTFSTAMEYQHAGIYIVHFSSPGSHLIVRWIKQ